MFSVIEECLLYAHFRGQFTPYSSPDFKQLQDLVLFQCHWSPERGDPYILNEEYEQSGQTVQARFKARLQGATDCVNGMEKAPP